LCARRSAHSGNGGGDSGHFSVAYHAPNRYVRRSGIESDIHMLAAMEYHASTTELVQMLRAGHHGVRLDEEAWDRLTTWIDLNCPYHGTWGELFGSRGVERQAQRRLDLLKRYANVDVNDEEIPPTPQAKVQPVAPQPPAPARNAPRAKARGWPFGADEAKRRQAALGTHEKTIDLGEGVKLQLACVPAGEFVTGAGAAARIDKPFWLGTCEVTNQQYARFDPLHDSRVEPKHGYQFGVHGYPANRPAQPVVRVSWRRAAAFCQWLTRRAGAAGLNFALPTEAQWEWACRAGSAGPFSYGGFEADFAKLANLGDATLSQFATNPYTEDQPMRNPNRFDDWVPKDAPQKKPRPDRRAVASGTLN